MSIPVSLLSATPAIPVPPLTDVNTFGSPRGADQGHLACTSLPVSGSSGHLRHRPNIPSCSLDIDGSRLSSLGYFVWSFVGTKGIIFKALERSCLPCLFRTSALPWKAAQKKACVTKRQAPRPSTRSTPRLPRVVRTRFLVPTF